MKDIFVMYPLKPFLRGVLIEILEIFSKKPVFEKEDSNCLDVFYTIRKQYNNKKHYSTKLTPIQASLKKNEAFVYQNL